MNPDCNIIGCRYLGEIEINGSWFCFYHYLLSLNQRKIKNEK